MGHNDHSPKASPDLCVSPHDFFKELVSDGLSQRKIKTYPHVADYLVDLLQFYMNADNLFDETDETGRRKRDTLAEMFLKASSAEHRVKIELLKKLGDSALYISGFFGDSLQRKIVDVDYYADMGGTAYGSLAECVREDMLAQVYKEFAYRFLEFVDVLTYISTKSLAHAPTSGNILRLYERYAKTGSEFAREQLLEQGLLAVPREAMPKGKQ